MSKHLIAVLCVVVAGIGMWAVTGSGQDSARAERQPTTLRMWIMDNGPDPVRDTERILEPFERRTGIEVKVELVGWDVQFDRIRTAARSGEGPDITQAGTTQVPYFASLGGFENFAPRVDDIGSASAYAPGVWKTTQVAGRRGVWAVPWFTEARAIYYRKDLLLAAGVDPATAFADWASFRRTLARLRGVRGADGEAVAPFGSPGGKAFDLVHHVAPFIWAAGGAELSRDGRRSAIATPKARAGVRFFADLIADGLYDESALDRDASQVEARFKRGKLATFIGGPWTLASADRTDDDAWSAQARENIGIAPLPAGPSGRSFTFVGGSNLMMLASSRHKREAWKLIRFLSEDETQAAYAALMGMFPARLAPHRAEGRRDSNRAAFFRAIEHGRTYAPIPEWGQIENAYRTRLGNVLALAAGRTRRPYGDRAVRTELSAAREEADALLQAG